MSRRALLSLAFVVGALLAGPSAVLADCLPPPPVDVAVGAGENVFVGTVTALAAQDRWAKVRVEEVWKGSDTGVFVEVRGGEDVDAFSSIDRTFVLGERYLFVVGFGVGVYSDNSCTPTTPWRDELAAARPADWFVPRGADGSPGSQAPDGPDLGPFMALGAFGVFAVGLVGGAWLISRRRDA